MSGRDDIHTLLKIEQERHEILLEKCDNRTSMMAELVRHELRVQRIQKECLSSKNNQMQM